LRVGPGSSSLDLTSNCPRVVDGGGSFTDPPPSLEDAFTALGYHRRVSEGNGKPLAERLEQIGAQLAWVRDYL